MASTTALTAPAFIRRRLKTVEIISERALLLVVSLGLLWAVDWLYVNVVVALFGSGPLGYPFNIPTAGFRAQCWALGLLPVVWLSTSARRPSQVLAWVIYLLVFVPTAVIAAYSTMPESQTLGMLMGMLSGLAVLSAAPLLPPLKFPSVRPNRTLFWTALGILTAATYVLTYLTFGATLRVVSLQDVYVQRAAAHEVAASPLVNYLLTWQSLAINPLFIAIAVVRRRPSLLAAGIAGELLNFAVWASRMALVSPFIIVGFYFLLSGERRFPRRAILASVVAFALPILTIATGLLSGFSKLLFDALLNRLVVNNGYLSFIYFRYFGDHPRVHFAQVKPFSLFVTSPYSESYPVALSREVFGVESDPNVNFLADGFAQLGTPGILLEAAVLAVAVWVLDSIARQRGISTRFVIMAFALQFMALANLPTSSVLLGTGFGILTIILYCMPMKDAEATGFAPIVEVGGSE